MIRVQVGVETAEETMIKAGVITSYDRVGDQERVQRYPRQDAVAVWQVWGSLKRSAMCKDRRLSGHIGE